MIAVPTETLSELYEKDETAWLDAMAELVQFGQTDAFDLPNLHDYLIPWPTATARKCFIAWCN